MKHTQSIRPHGVLALCLGLLLCLCLALTGCSDVGGLVSAVAAGEFPVTVNDVTINARPQKVVVLSPSLADVVVALNCEAQLAAGSQTCTQESLRDLQKLDPADVEAITALGPDLVLLDPSSSGAEQALRDAGLAVLNLAPATDRQDFERLYAQASSALTGDGPGYDAGIAAAQDIFKTLDDVNRIVPKDTITAGCYLYDLDGSGVTGDMLASTIMTYSGVENVFSDLVGGQYDFEQLRLSNPHIIFCMPGLKDELKQDARFRDLRAVKQGRVVELDPSMMEWQGRTVVDAALEISAAAFPELLEDSSMQVTDPTENIESEVSSALTSSALAQDDVTYETLQRGDQGDDVLEMQTLLDRLGYLDTEYDGLYGEYTADCVKAFQKENGLPETGIADSDTQKMLHSTLAKPKPGTSPAPITGGSPAPGVSPEPSASPVPESTGE